MPSGGTFDVPSLQESLKTIEKKLLVEDLWNDREKAQKLLITKYRERDVGHQVLEAEVPRRFRSLIRGMKGVCCEFD